MLMEIRVCIFCHLLLCELCWPQSDLVNVSFVFWKSLTDIRYSLNV